MEKDKIFKKYQGYAINTATKLWDSWEHKNSASFQYISKEDIIQEAYIKLLEVMDKIDNNKTDAQIILFIVQSIKNHILNMFRNMSRMKNTYCFEHNNLDELEAIQPEPVTPAKIVVDKFFEHLNKNEIKFVGMLLDKATKEEIIQTFKWTEKTLMEKKEKFKLILEEIINEQR